MMMIKYKIKTNQLKIGQSKHTQDPKKKLRNTYRHRDIHIHTHKQPIKGQNQKPSYTCKGPMRFKKKNMV